jgi:hypothetical protein
VNTLCELRRVPRRSGRALSSTWIIRAAAVLLLSISFGCHDLTNVDAPDLVVPSALDNPTGALSRYSGAISDFAAAYAKQVSEAGLLADEFRDLNNSIISPDRRAILPINRYPFVDLSRARISALRAITALQQYAPEPRGRIGEMYALVGFVEVMLAENVCAPVPLANLRNSVPTDAPPLARAALIDEALAMFDSAEANSGTSDTVTNLARVGSARALLLRGDFDAAAAAVASVPREFVYSLPYSPTVAGQTNWLYSLIGVDRSTSVSNLEGTNGLPFISGSDGRIGADSIGVGPSGLPVYNFAKDAGLGASILLAGGVEAQLIVAEAALHDQDIDVWASILNGLRETGITPSIVPLPPDSTADATDDLRVDALFHERAFWLFGTGHRHGDLLRLIRQYGRATEATFPTGPYGEASGINYGTDVLFTPAGEEANQLYGGCTEGGA